MQDYMTPIYVQSWRTLHPLMPTLPQGVKLNLMPLLLEKLWGLPLQRKSCAMWRAIKIKKSRSKLILLPSLFVRTD